MPFADSRKSKNRKKYPYRMPQARAKRKRRFNKERWIEGALLLLILALLCLAAYKVDQKYAVQSMLTTQLESLRTTTAQWAFGEQSPATVVAAFGEVEAWAQTQTEEVVAAMGTLAWQAGNVGDVAENRAQTLFPDTVDDTVYDLTFACTTPVEGTISSPFGERVSPTSGEDSFHYGLDIAADQGTPIASIADGTVAEVGENSYGNYVIVTHDNGTRALYAHCDTIAVAQGEVVSAAQTIATVGSTGLSTGNHLHIELWYGGKVLNPATYLY